MSYMASPNTAALASYFDAHNAYVAQLHATNDILEHFGTDTLPALMQVGAAVSLFNAKYVMYLYYIIVTFRVCLSAGAGGHLRRPVRYDDGRRAAGRRGHIVQGKEQAEQAVPQHGLPPGATATIA